MTLREIEADATFCDGMAEHYRGRLLMALLSGNRFALRYCSQQRRWWMRKAREMRGGV